MVDVLQTVPTVVEVDSLVYEQDVETLSGVADLVDYGENTVMATIVEVIERGPQGPRGDKASISADRPNALELGSDQKMLVRNVMGTECATDFSTIYALSK